MSAAHALFKLGVCGNHTLNWAALASILLSLRGMLTPARIAFGMILLPGKLYAIGMGLVLTPVVVMELCTAVGLVRHRHGG